MYRPVGPQRSVALVIILSIVTFGIYAIIWQYKSFKEIKDFSGTGIGGVVGLLLAIFLSIVNVFLLPSEVGNLYAGSGQAKPVSGLTGFWVLIPLAGGFIWFAKVQGSLNRFWQQQATGGTAAAGLPYGGAPPMATPWGAPAQPPAADGTPGA